MELQGKRSARVPMKDERIVALYWERDERAIEETDFKYKNYLYTVAYHIIHDNSDCEECLNDTYLGAWNAMPPTKPAMLKAFLTTILRRVAIKRYHHGLRQRAIPSELTLSLGEVEEFIADDGDVDAEFNAKRLGLVLSAFVHSLSPHRRYIFMSRYYIAEPIDTIAGVLQVSRSTVNKELAAIRLALKEKLEKEGYSV